MTKAMKRVLYLSNIEVPYRARFFNELAKVCDLTVVYERRSSANRDSKWNEQNEQPNYPIEYLDGFDIGNEFGFSWKIVPVISRGWDVVVVGCYNSPIQMVAMRHMNLAGIRYIVNLDGEPFIGSGLKGMVKRLILMGAAGYLVAGEQAAVSLRKAIGTRRPIIPYYFSSLSRAEIESTPAPNRGDYALVVGQYFDYKGMDVAMEAARRSPAIRYKFVGMGKRTEKFIRDMSPLPSNVEIIPFLQKEKLMEEYGRCGVVVLPSRQECWGLVVNEAAAVGAPIVSTWGSGAAVEFLKGAFEEFLAEPGNPESLLTAIELCLRQDNGEYSSYLIAKSAEYTIERSAEEHLKAIESIG